MFRAGLRNTCAAHASGLARNQKLAMYQFDLRDAADRFMHKCPAAATVHFGHLGSCCSGGAAEAQGAYWSSRARRISAGGFSCSSCMVKEMNRANA